MKRLLLFLILALPILAFGQNRVDHEQIPYCANGVQKWKVVTKAVFGYSTQWYDADLSTPYTPLGNELVGSCLDYDTNFRIENIFQEVSQQTEAREMIYIRLDGDSANPTAVPFDADDAEATGSAGVSYTLNIPFYSYSVVWLRTAAQDSQLTVNQRAYLAGSAGGSAGYATVLPNIQNNDSEIYSEDYTFTAGAGAVVEIAIKKPK